MAKPRRVLSEVSAFRRTLDLYTGRAFIRRQLAPIRRVIPTPSIGLRRLLPF